ncbi:MAG TPA: C25 family cysteine peptidase, partial [Candidatus Acidoferrales bacterium]|nr:C25 family cysteine peptidase [Candidatus Acidoferrales bacterium]
PHNYLGMGDRDFVPSRMIETQAFKTASDDWFTDFNGSGYATIPTGRIPADTPDQAAVAVSKIVAYENGSTAGTWQQTATFIADQNVGADFTSATETAATLAPKSLNINKILTDGEDPSTAQQQIVAAIDNGTGLVDYNGHGAEDQWSFNDIFDDTTVPTLTNGDKQPVFLLMDCLNGFFEDVYSTSLAEDLLFAPNGGASAVWASSGFTEEPPQATMNQALMSALAANPNQTLGEAILKAKSGITDDDVRRTWTLFGDPAMRLPIPAAPKAAHKR